MKATNTKTIVENSSEEIPYDCLNFVRLEQQIEACRQAFQTAKPFRYLVIDGFCNETLADRLADAFPARQRDWIDASGTHTRNKWTSPVVSDSAAKRFFSEVQSPRFLAWLETVTGISNFICDDAYFGAGFHQTGDSGFLDVHIDFNKLPNGLDRRLNLLVYMNKRWEADWGGELELWDMQQKHCIERIAPLFNRAVIFETNEISYHGHPKPVQTAEQATRNSFSVYYYTQGRPEAEAAPYHSTVYVNTEGREGRKKILLNMLRQIVTFKPLLRRVQEKLRKNG